MTPADLRAEAAGPPVYPQIAPGGTEPRQVRHLIGSTRTIQTAVLVCEYLRKRCALECKINPDSISYVFKDPTPDNGWWSADIVVTTYSFDSPSLDASHILVNTCRAFVAGRGEIWT